MKQKRVGIIVARFQVPQLHHGHRSLIEYVQRRNDDVVIVLGVATSLPTPQNPLSFEIRKQMISREYPGVHIVPIVDTKSEDHWNAELDNLIVSLTEKRIRRRNITLYGSRDSFLKTYKGMFRTHMVRPFGNTNGTAVRNALQTPINAVRFREGIIYAHAHRLPAVYSTIDVAILRNQHSDVLLGGRRSDHDKLRFIGGFVDPADDSLEMAAKREVFEEAGGIQIDEMRMIGSKQIDDWRYRNTEDRIITTLFTATYIFGIPRAGDDLDTVQWVPIHKIPNVLVPEHLPLGQMLMKSL